MFEKTQHDLSWGKVKLDAEALTYTADMAFAYALREVHSLSGELLRRDGHESPSREHLTAQNLEKAARILATVAETRYALHGLDMRPAVEIINHNLVDDYHGAELEED